MPPIFHIAFFLLLLASTASAATVPNSPFQVQGIKNLIGPMVISRKNHQVPFIFQTFNRRKRCFGAGTTLAVSPSPSDYHVT